MRVGAIFLFLIATTAFSSEPNVSAMKASTVKIVVASEVRTATQQGVIKSGGSGYLTGGGRYVVTNNHVCCSPAREGMVILRTLLMVHYSKDEKTPARVVWNSPLKDLSVLELQTPISRPVVTFAKDATLEDGMRVWATGFPGEAEQPETTVESDFIATATNGIIGKFVDQVLRPNGPVVHTISHSAATNPGNSGGPLFNFCGQVVATNFAKALATIRQRVNVRDPNTGQVVEREVQQRVVAADGINWSIRNGELFPELQRLNIKYEEAPDRCVEIDTETKKELTSMGGRMSTLVVTQFGSVALALVAVGLAMNRRVRQTVSRRLTTYRRSEPDFDRQHGHGHAHTPPPPHPPPAAAGYRLKGLSGYYAGQSIPLEAKTFTFGRDRSVANIVFPPDSAHVSKRHCTVRYDPSTGKVLLEDTSSSNGTYLDDGRRLNPGQPHELRPGDRFYLGERGNLFELT